MTWSLDEPVRRAATALAERAPTVDRPCLRVTRERPCFERALAEDLNRALPDGLTARTGGTPGLTDFPALGAFDVSVTAPGGPPYEAVLEFKWWGPPGVRSKVADKRRETLWDGLKIACSVAAGRAAAGYLVVLAPDAAWAQDHVYSRLARGDRTWETSELCRAPERPMKYFDDRHFGVTAVPTAIAVRLVASATVLDQCHGERWTMKALAVEPRGPMGLLENVRLELRPG